MKNLVAVVVAEKVDYSDLGEPIITSKWSAVINSDFIASIECLLGGLSGVVLKDGRTLFIIEDYYDLCERIGVDPYDDGQDDDDDDDSDDDDDTQPDGPPAVSREEFVGMWGVK